MGIRFVNSFHALPTLMLIACASEPERVAQQPSVATRHALAALSGRPATPPSAAPATDAAHAFVPPAELRLPSTLQPGDQVPLLLVLHGFGVSSSLLIAKAGLNQIADQRKFAYLAPEGLRDALGRPYWNAGKSCCDWDRHGVDDVKRLRELLAANLDNPAIDTRRVFIIGYSNGGFMAQRLACDVGDRIAGVISVAGAAPSTDVPCTQHTRLSFLEIHGDADPIVRYAGGTVFDRTDVAAHASTPDTVRYWAQRLACAAEPQEEPSLDLEPYLPERETSVLRFQACQGSVELWTVHGGGHYVALQPPALEAMWSFMLAHPKGD